MKKVVCLALMLSAVAAVSASAQVRVEPIPNANYHCHYTNYSGPAIQDGFSKFGPFTRYLNGDLLRGIESFQSLFNGQVIWDNRKVAFAKPVDGYDYLFYSYATTWEFTINPSGPQCKNTEVTLGGNWIKFDGCTDGHSRICSTY